MRWSPTAYVVFWSVAMLLSLGLGGAILWQLHRLTAAVLQLVQFLKGSSNG